MEVSNGAIGQRGGGGGTLLCIPSDTLADDKRLKKRSRRLLVSDSTGESHNNAKRSAAMYSTAFNFKLPGTTKTYPGTSTTNSSLDPPVDSSRMPEPESCDQSRHETWEFETLVPFSCETPSLLSSDVISTIDYDETGQLIATGGLARKIRICSYQELVNGMGRECFQGRNVKNLFTTICMPAKLSSLKWRPGGSEVIACGDYDGSVTEWDVEHGVTVSERYEHTGRTVWSIDYSRDFRGLLASASSDSTVRFWSRNVERSVGIIKSLKRNSMCCVEFGRSSGPCCYVAVACADASVYLYDMRSLGSPVATLRGHERSVSYVRWLGENSLVSSSPDGTIRLWDIASTVTGTGESWHARNDELPIARTFGCHSNTRNFVGLSVASSGGGSGGLIASGSENNEVFVYSSSVSERPVFRHKFNDAVVLDDKAFVGSVCWTKQQDHLSLISANSEGIVQVIRATTTATARHT
ncbi:hypothetical protein SELMODRAFT_147206 [Selaginella moellendorffii]|uniref:Uncharacterized protein n=1 Tax=Selaginella moellendorffii TaxID=88036 RepID=D8RH86_SELML|nr:WD repeat-containing protein RUP2 [Selaginella moellendorffii]XP_024530945.1 WD repeat-containing protein RUP2 [Selaginella moellendorffii]XP_024530946.1 WD repeat-containing protein RUP2 [Selaginella moellendorffii]EFJ28487.1 hypothetical protein SELMODRAFT_147206 [Selaginella moellendorffii]|eukprot:XP_002970357.1 WD repeat-containing protein RUP2 [Selaginella moellendorffii]